jgi:uncharacterized protein YndB with AHSA1/START domain
VAKVSATRFVAVPQEQVWALLADVQNARKWNHAWQNIELTSNQSHGAGTTFRTTTESGDVYDFEVCEWVAPERISFCPIRHPGEQMYSITLESHTFALRPEEEGTLVELTAHATSRGPRGWIVAMFFWPGHQREGLTEALERVAAVFEGEPETGEQEAGPETLTE